MTSTTDTADVLERAAKQAVVTGTANQARFLLDTVGARVTTAAVGLKDARTVRGWADGRGVKQPLVEDRLHHLFLLVWALSEVYSPAVATSFLRGANPMLGDRSPLVVLATGEPEQDGPALVAAARSIIEG